MLYTSITVKATNISVMSIIETGFWADIVRSKKLRIGTNYTDYFKYISWEM